MSEHRESEPVLSEQYRALYARSLEDPNAFWASEAGALKWFRRWDKVVDWRPPHAHWFVGGTLNASDLCVDRHVEAGLGDKAAIHWQGEDGEERTLTYADLQREVNRGAAMLKRLGIGKGDVVAIYMPLIPELMVLMLACARIGAPHTVVFSGFSAQALADRMIELDAKVLITADGGYRRGKVIPLKSMADEAVAMASSVRHQVVVRRTGTDAEMTAGRDVWLHEALADDTGETVEPESVEATDPIFVLFTSGTTGKPKGIVHNTGGYLVYVNSTFRWVFNTDADSIFWCTADMGWVTGHSYGLYGPMMSGVTQVVYEGAPDYPGPDRWWQIVERYGVTHFYTSPTAIRSFMALGREAMGSHDISSLRLLGSVGEPINPEAWHWYHENVGGDRCPIVDTWWQTETGGIMISNTPGIGPAAQKPSAAGPPIPGVDVHIVDQDGNEVESGERGLLTIKPPWPGMLAGIHGDDERYQKTYWERFPGFFYSGDYARRDEDGYIWLLGRADEVIKVAGHRLGSMELESVAVAHPAIAEAAVVPRPHDVKGDVVVLFALLGDGFEASDELTAELKAYFREAMGPIAVPEAVFFVHALPKTRSGKIMRRVLRAVASDRPVGDLTTLEDEASVAEVKAAYDELRKTV
jgi:acetyl-CoA synthetase